MENKNKIVGEIEKNITDVVRITRGEYNGHDYIDIRLFYKESGEFKPTKKGVALHPSKIDDLIRLLSNAKKVTL